MRCPCKSDAADNKISNTVIVNVMKSKISLTFRYKHNRIEPIMLCRSCLYMKIKLHICYVASWLVFTLNELYFVINDSLDRFPKQLNKCASNWYILFHWCYV